MSLTQRLLAKELGEQLRILFAAVISNSKNINFIVFAVKQLKQLNKNLAKKLA